MMVANHKHREAFSSNEVQVTKERLNKLQDLMNNLNTVWKSVRWLMDVITYARSKEKSPELEMKRILEFNIAVPSIPTSTSSHLLELPSKDGRIKSPTRGSWPGPAQSNNLMTGSSTFLSAEHSKSEQNLPIDQNFMESGHLSVASCMSSSSRKNSGDSNYYSSGEIIAPRQMLPPSKSEETLFALKKKGPTNLHHRKRTTTATTVPQNHSITGRSSNAEKFNVNVQSENSDRTFTAPRFLVSPSGSIFSTKLYKKNSKKHLLEPTMEANKST